MLSRRDIGLSLFSIEYNLSLDRKIVFQIFPASEKCPPVAHLLNIIVTIVRYSMDNFSRMNFDISAVLPDSFLVETFSIHEETL